MRPDFFLFKWVSPKFVVAAIYSAAAFAFLYVMWNEPPDANAGKRVNTPARSVPPPDPVEIAKVLAYARTHIPAARRSGEAWNFFETAEASMRDRPAQTGDMAAAILTQFRAAQPDNWKDIFRRFTASIEAAKVKPDAGKLDWSTVSPRVRVVPFRLLPDALMRKNALELDKDQKELALAWLREQNGNPEVSALGGECRLIFDSLKAVLFDDFIQSAVRAEQALKKLKPINDPAAVNLLFEAMGIPGPEMASDAAEGLTWRLTPAEFATAFFNYLSTNSSYHEFELENYRKALKNKCLGRPQVLAAAFEAHLKTENNDIQNVSWVKKLLFIDVMAEIGTEAQIPSLSAFERDRTFYETVKTSIQLPGPKTAYHEHVDARETPSFRDRARDAVKKIRERKK